MCKNVHSRGVEPDEERLVIFDGSLDEVLGLSQNLLIYSLHAFFGQRSGILTHLLAPRPEARHLCSIILV